MEHYAKLTFENLDSLKLIRLYRKEMEKMQQSDNCIKLIIDEKKSRVAIQCMKRLNSQEYTQNKMTEMRRWLSNTCDGSIKVDDKKERDIIENELTRKKACFTFTESIKLFRVYTRKKEELISTMRSLHSILGRTFEEKQTENVSVPLAAGKCPEHSLDSKTKTKTLQSIQTPRTSMSTSKISTAESVRGQQQAGPKPSSASIRAGRKGETKDPQTPTSDDKQLKATSNQGAESSTLRIHLPNNDSANRKADARVPKLNEDLKLNVTLEDGLIFRIYKADITTILLDAIVNPANELLRNTGGAADAISKAAGAEYDSECQQVMRKKKRIKTTENVVTKSGNLPCAYVINAVGPQWVDYKDKLDCLKDLEKTIIEILETAEKRQMDSIAIPPISSGIFGVPWELCAPMYINSITKFGSKKRKHLQEVHLVDLTNGILDLSCYHYKVWVKHKKLDPKQLLQEFSTKNPQAMSGPTVLQKPAVLHKPDNNPLSTENSTTSLCKFLGNTKEKQTYEMDGKLKVLIYRDDLVRIDGIDMLVSPENSAFTGSGALAQSILRSAGPKYKLSHQIFQEEVYKSRNALKPGDIRVTHAGDLKYRFVLHVVFHRFSDQRPPHDMELKDLKSTVKKVLNHLDTLAMCNMRKAQDNVKINSIAMPLLGAGRIENPNYLEKICLAVYDAIEDYVETSRTSILKEIHLVSYFEATNTAFANIFLAMSKQDYIRSRQKPPTQRPTAENLKYQDEMSKALSPVAIWKMDSKRKIQPDLQTFFVELKKPLTEDCVICMDTFTNPVKLRKCNHIFCKKCITDFFSLKSACPVCNTTYGTIYGDQPRKGTATIYLEKTPLPGHKDGTFVIMYDFPDGIQEECHPHPGTSYKGTHRQAYLPASKEGTAVLHMLERAFKQGLIFTVGSSRTTGRNNVVTWNDIHHKTRTTGGPERFGYPDPDYLLRVREELEAKGITDEEDREQQ